MKKISLVLCLFTIFFACFSASSINASASDPLDVINDYAITVTPLDDATLQMECRIFWTVLDDSSQGPLTWVHIGIPNLNVSSIKALTSNISEIKREGEYIDAYFTKSYHKGETVEFAFSWVQDYLFTLSNDGEYIRYIYTPGWFDEIEVKHLTITWKSEGAVSHEMSVINAVPGGVKDVSNENALVLEANNVGFGGKVELSVVYPVEYFPYIDTNHTIENASHDNSWIAIVVIFAVGIALILIVYYVQYRKYGDPDYWTGGYTEEPAFVPGRHWIFFHGSGHYSAPPAKKGTVPAPSDSIFGSGGKGGGGGGSCACACACACAGGGRAGCSLKNFVGTQINIDFESLPSEDDE